MTLTTFLIIFIAWTTALFIFSLVFNYPDWLDVRYRKNDIKLCIWISIAGGFFMTLGTIVTIAKVSAWLYFI